MEFSLRIALTSLAIAVSSGCANASDCRSLIGSRIESEGTYCFSASIKSSDGLIIDADNVRLDLRGNCLNGYGGPSTTTTGILVAANRSNIAIQNGCISDFMYGFRSNPGSKNIRISRILFKRSTFRAALVESNSATIEDNTVEGVGGTSVIPDASTMALDVRGDECTIRNNQIREVYPVGSGDSVAIAQSGLNCIVADNLIENIQLSEWGRTYGISVSRDTKLDGNRTVRQTYGFVGLELSALQSGNVSIDDACIEETTSCPDNIDRALGSLSIHDADDGRRLFRVGRAFHRAKNYARAAIYYLAAGKSGVQEGQRIVERHLKFGYISLNEKSSAERTSDEIVSQLRTR